MPDGDFACLVVYEFADEPRSERLEIYRGTEENCNALAGRLERASFVRYDGEREPIHAFAVVSRVADLDEEPS